MTATQSAITDNDYIAFVGRNAQKYLPRFKKFNVLGMDNFKPAWHWPAFFFGPFWMFYRKLYLWGLLALFLEIIPYVNFIAMISWGVAGYYLYYRNTKKKILALRAVSPDSDLSKALGDIGGVHAWLLKVYVGFIVLVGAGGIILAIAIPQYQTYQRRAAEDAARQQQAQAEKEATEWFNKGMAFSESHNYSDAIAAYDKAIELNPNDADFFTMRGVAYDDSGNVQEAIIDYNKALELNPKHGDAYLFRGDDFGKLGDEQQKINDFIMAARLGQKRAQEFLQSANIQW